MYDKAQLEQMSTDQLKSLAESLAISPVNSLPPEVIIERILAKNTDSSSFISLEEQNLEEIGDASEFITDLDEQSGFITNSDQSGFITEEHDASGFIVDQEQSGFITESDASGFIVSTIDTPSRSKVHQLGAGDLIVLNEKSYIITQIVSQSSGEAVIYKIKDENEQLYALKLYREVSNIKREPNATALERIRKVDDIDILKLHDFGTGEQKYQGKYCFEISAFAEGGDLLSVENFKEKYSYHFILNEIVPQLFSGIKLLHDQKIYHCDLKPRNVFFLDEARQDIVIGDYGSAKTFTHGYEQEHKSYSEVIGTKTYVAPEQANGIISEKIDYYAFGMILLHLLYPEAMTFDDDPSRIDRQKMHKIKERQYEQVGIYQFAPEYRKLNQLIEGLTLYDHKARWGQQEVERWLTGTHVSVQYHAQAVIKPVKLGWTTIRLPEDLIQAVEAFPAKQWYSDLIQDPINFQELMIWLNNIRDAQQRKAFQRMLIYYQDEKASGISREERVPYIKESIIQFFDPYRPISLGDESFDFIHTEDVIGEVSRFFSVFDQFWKKTPLNKLRYTLFKFEFALRKAELLCSGERKKTIGNILNIISAKLKQEPFASFETYHTSLHKLFIADSKKEITFYKNLLYLLYAFTPKRGFRNLENQAATSLENLGLFFARNQGLFGNKTLQLEKAFFLNQIQQYPLHKLGYENFLFEVFKDKVATHFELEKVKMESDRNVVFKYKYYKTLSDYFKKEGINNQLVRPQTGNNTYVVKKGIFQGPGKVFNEFLIGIRRQLNIPENVLTVEVKEKLKKQVKKALWQQGFILHTGEWLGAIILLIPFLGGAGLALLKSPDGIPIGEQLFYGLQLNNYTFDPEVNYNTITGFYFICAFFIISYLLALIPRLWCRQKLALVGPQNDKEPDLLSLNTTSALLVIIMMLLAPTVFSFANWLYEPIGWGLLLIMGGVLTFSTGRKRMRILGIMVLLTTILRIAYMIQIGFDFNKFEFLGRQNRGFIDLGLYTLMFIVAFIPAIVYQFFKAHSTFYFSLKVLVLALMIGIFGLFNLGIGSVGNQNWSYIVPGLERFAERESDTDLVRDTHIGELTDEVPAVNIRSTPKVKNDNKVGIMVQGEQFLVTKDPDSNWWFIKTKSGIEGYMDSGYINIIRQAIAQDLEDY